MVVRVPFHLLRRQIADNTAALLLLSSDARELLNLCGRLGADPMPSVFAVVGGFLVIPDAVPESLLPRTIRLRRISENCFVPVDADLVPALHPTEAADLTRNRGLVFLPNHQCLAFDPESPLTLRSLLRVPTPKLADYQPFPQPQRLAERLTLITCVTPEITPENILEAGSEGIGEEAPSRPPSVNPVTTAGGKLTYRLGASLAALGARLGIGALARLGQNLVHKSVSAVPRLSESLLGRQAAALNELLRKFREGEIEEALRHALPMSGTGSTPYSSDRLPTHDIRYSLSNVLGSDGRAGAWLGGIDVQRELRNEYRKAAQAALARGDYRRAAFIYGKLLGDLANAAGILGQGGLHRDAAILYRDRLQKPRLAAREFEAAGECDEALRLFRQLGDHEAAGDLFNRMGEPEQAIAEYHEAARTIIHGNLDYLKAGELMLRKTGRAELAGAYFALGWRERDNPRASYAGNAVPCATRLAEIYAFGSTLEPFWTLIDEVEDWLKPNANPSVVANFFNAVVTLGDLPHLTSNRPALRDRAKLALAAKLRETPRYESRLGNAVGELFGNSGPWSPAIVSDADFAARQALKHTSAPAPRSRPIGSLRLGNVEVTAAVHAPASGEIFVGFVTGEVLAFDPTGSRISQIAPPNRQAITALAVDISGRTIVAEDGNEPDAHLHGYRRDESGQVIHYSQRFHAVAPPGWYYLIPFILEDPTLSTSAGIVTFRGANLAPREPPEMRGDASAAVYLILRAGWNDPGAFFQLTNPDRPVIDSGASLPLSHNTPRLWLAVEDRAVSWSGRRVTLRWQPTPLISNVRQMPIAWMMSAVDQLEIAGISDPGILNWSEVTDPTSKKVGPRSLAFGNADDFRAVTIWKPGRIVGITARNWIYWLRASGNVLEEWLPPTKIPFPTQPVAIFPSHATEEVIVVLKDGELVRVPIRT